MWMRRNVESGRTLGFFARMTGSLGVPPSEIDNTKEEIDVLGEIRTYVWTCLVLSLKKKWYHLSEMISER